MEEKALDQIRAEGGTNYYMIAQSCSKAAHWKYEALKDKYNILIYSAKDTR